MTAFSRKIATGLDDAEYVGSSHAIRGDVGTSSDLEIVDDGLVQSIGLRFPNITIPQGATINSAYVQFTADGTPGNTGNDTLTIRGVLTPNYTDNLATEPYPGNRTQTTASASWGSIPSWTAGQATENERTADVSSVIEEIVGQATWASGNALVLYITGGNTGMLRRAEAFEGGSTAAPELVVDYTEGAAEPVYEQTDFQLFNDDGTGLGPLP